MFAAICMGCGLLGHPRMALDKHVCFYLHGLRPATPPSHSFGKAVCQNNMFILAKSLKATKSEFHMSCVHKEQVAPCPFLMLLACINEFAYINAKLHLNCEHQCISAAVYIDCGLAGVLRVA
jgi:hypothetical protein